MKKVFIFSSLTIFVLLVNIFLAQEKARVSYPVGYRDWSQVKTILINDQKHPLLDPFGVHHHIYLNKKGSEAYKREDLSRRERFLSLIF
jgi:hypothetical protein